MIQAPVTYQGAKTRIASKVVDVIFAGTEASYLDLCCGSGAISIELRRRGVPPEQIAMVDRGPWGLVWESIGAQRFPLAELRRLVASMPENRDDVKAWIVDRVAEPVPEQPEALFLLIQASAVGGAYVGIDHGRWRPTSGFRSYWKPTATSSRRSPVNPMMPMPATILERTEALVESMAGVRAVCDDVHAADFTADVVYVDPPYEGTTGYDLGVVDLEALADTHRAIWVSEGRPLGERSEQITRPQAKGGMTGGRKRAHAEWLSWLSRREG